MKTLLNNIESAALFVEVAQDLWQIRKRFSTRVDKFKDDYIKALGGFEITIQDFNGRKIYVYKRKNGLVVKIYQVNIDYLTCVVTLTDGTVLTSDILNIRNVRELTDRDPDVKIIESIGPILSVFCRWDQALERQRQKKQFESDNEGLIQQANQRFSKLFGRGGK